jgi:hypothetical protein
MLLEEFQNRKISFVLKYNYTQLYNRLKVILSPEDLLLFSRPDMYSDVNKWSVENSSLIEQELGTYSGLSEEDKDDIADDLETRKASILKVLLATSEFKKIAEDLFIVPSSENIYAVKTEKGLRAILTQWGCKSNEVNSSVDSLNTVIHRPRTNTDRVLIEAVYTDGSPAAEKLIFIAYLSRETREKTNKEGLYDRGRCKLNTSFTVYEKINEKESSLHEFTVTSGGKYLVTFPIYTRGSIKVVNQKNLPIPDASILLEYEGEQSQIQVGKTGEYPLESLEVGKSISIKEASNPENQVTHIIQKEGNEIILQIHETMYADVIVKVIDEQRQALPNYPIQIEIEEASREYTTQAEGIFMLTHLQVGTLIKAINPKNTENQISYTVVEDYNELVIQVEKPIEKKVTVKLINHKKDALPNVPIDFQYSQQEKQQVTNSEGICTFPFETFQDKEKVKTLIHLTQTNKKGKKKERKIKKSFRFEQEKLEYIIQLKKPRNWWWLLLLLLPLLLLIRCEKTVFVQVLDAEKQPIQKLPVSFSHQKAYLFDFDTNKWLTNDGVKATQSSNEKGIAQFDTLKYSVYSFIFHHFSRAEVMSSAANECYTTETLNPVFHQLWHNTTLTLTAIPISTSIDFLVIDNEDGEPIPDAEVELIATLNGKEYAKKLKADAAGRVVFENIPQCANLRHSIGNAEGYYADSITQKPIKGLLSAEIDPTRTLRLKPIKEKLVFYVIDCQTKQPIPDALVTIEIEGKKKSQKRTNVNGVGKGEFEDAHIIAEVDFTAEKPYYKKGKLPKKYKVGEFIKLPKEQRTICLEPEPQALTLNNCDEDTGLPLAGVKNKVTIRRGDKERVEELISNVNGKFVIPDLRPDDILTIIASYPPDYLDNVTKVKNKKAKELLEGQEALSQICLKKKIDPTIPQVPKQNCRAFFTGLIAGGEENIEKGVSEIFQEGSSSEYIGQGEYPDNTKAFPRSVATTFDGLAIDKNTRVIIYSKPNFQGEILLDKVGPAVINNIKWINHEEYSIAHSAVYPAELQALFPPSLREWSKSDMHEWSYGSVKVICQQK